MSVIKYITKQRGMPRLTEIKEKKEYFLYSI